MLVDDRSDVLVEELLSEEVNFPLFGRISVVVKNFGNFAAFADSDSEFFAQLSSQCIFQRFTVMNFASGKFPFESGSVVVSTLPNQDTAIGSFDNSGYDNHSELTRK